MHLHVSALDALTLLAYLIIIGALWRVAATYLASKGSSFGEAMGFVL